ncbi:MAG: hypothetical protein WAU45_23805 [Blastocatellia bacterium]
MMAPFWRDLLRKTVLIGSLGSIGLALLVAILSLTAQIATYGLPVKLLVSLGLVVAVALGSRYAIRRRGGQVIRWEYSWWIAGLVVAAVFLLANQIILRGIAVGIWDAEGSFYPFQVLLADYAQQGRLLHWDPWSNGGLPLAMSPEVGAFSPVNLGVGLLTGGTSVGFRVYWLVVWSLGGLGILMLARELKAPAWGGAAVAIGFLFCGIYTGNAEHTSWIVAFSFLPLIIWRLDHALVSRRLRPAAEAGALWGLSALSGYPGQTIITAFFCVLWAAGRVAFPECRTPNPQSSIEILRKASAIRAHYGLLIAALAILGVLGLAVLSPTYYAFFAEGAGTSARSGPLSREVAVLSNALDPGALSTLASAYVATLSDEQLWPGTELAMCSIYSGAAIPVFALLSMLARPRDRWRWWLVILAGLSLACALGGSLPLRGWLYDWIYPMRFFRHPSVFRSYFVFTISVLALVGIRDLQAAMGERTDPVWRRFRIASLVCATTAFATFLAVVGAMGAERSISLRQAPGIWLVFSGGWLAILGLGMLNGVWTDSIRLRYFSSILLAIVAGDALLTFAVSQANMLSTSPENVARWQRLDARHSAILDLTANGLMREQSPCVSNDVAKTRSNRNPHSAIPCPFSDQLITKIPVLEAYSPMTNSFHLRIAKHPILKEMAIGSERTWFSAEVLQVPVTDDCFAAFERRSEALHAPPLLIHSFEDLVEGTGETSESENLSSDLARIDELPTCNRIPVRVRKYDPEELYFDASCPADGWLLVTDRWGPAWRAEVNGESTEVFGGNFIFRAVRVRAGENSIRFTYHPPLSPWLLILSWTTLGGTAVWSASSAVRRMKNSRTARAAKSANDRNRGA